MTTGGAGPSDLEVIQRVRKGEGEAFRLLVERYQGRAYRLALRVLRDEEATRDAVQDAFVKAFSALASFEGRSGFFTWFYRLVMNQCLSVWYSAPTAIRLLMREGGELARRFDLRSLRHLASVGEPLKSPEAVVWSQEVFGRPYHDTFWQTETGAIVIANLPGTRIKPGSMGKPVPGITATVLDPETLRPLEELGKAGLIALRSGWPSMLRAYWNNPEAYAKKFRGEWYLCGDKARIDADGYFWFVGRDDDVINTGGHLVGPFEIESALLEHKAVAESAAVAKPANASNASWPRRAGTSAASSRRAMCCASGSTKSSRTRHGARAGRRCSNAFMASAAAASA